MTTTDAKIRQTALANLGPNSLLRRHWLAAGAAAMLSLSAALPVAAQNYPNRPITLIVPWGAGGGTDATARTFIATASAPCLHVTRDVARHIHARRNMSIASIHHVNDKGRRHQMNEAKNLRRN